MDVDSALSLVFAVGVVVACGALLAAFYGRATRSQLAAAATAVGIGAAAAWIGFAFELDLDSALAAAGLTVCCVVCLGAIGVLEGVLRARRLDGELTTAETRLRDLIEREATARSDELERTLARARADSPSRLAEEERRIADTRRSELAERERRVSAELGDSLTLVERRVEKRLTEWSADLDRIQQALGTRLAELSQKQQELFAKAHASLETEAAQVKTAAEEQRETVQRLREE